jgi:hypothetical protein
MGVYKYTGNKGKDVIISDAQLKAMRSKTTDVDIKLTKTQLSSMKQVSGLKGTVSDKAILKAFVTYSLKNLL